MTASLRLALCSTLLLASISIARADEVTPELTPEQQADALLEEATRLFTEDADYDAALSKFQESYRLRPNWKALNGIALVYTQQGKYVEAIETYERLIDEFGPTLSEGQASTVKKRMHELESRVGAVDIVVPQDGAIVTIDGQELGRGPYKGRLRLLPGTHTLVATLEGYRTFTQKITVEPGGQVTLEVKLDKERVRVVMKDRPARFERRLPEWVPWVTMGAGVALAVGGGGLHIWAADDFDSFDQSVATEAAELMASGGCPEGSTCPVDGDQSLKDSGETKQVVAVSMYVTGGVLLTGGLVLLFVNRPQPVYEKGSPEGAADARPPRRGVDVQPWIGPGVAGMGISLPF